MGQVNSQLWLVPQLQNVTYDRGATNEGAGCGFSGQVDNVRTASCIALSNTHAAA